MQVELEKARQEIAKLAAELNETGLHSSTLENELMELRVKAEDSEGLVHNLQNEKHDLEMQYKKVSDKLVKVSTAETTSNAEKRSLGHELEAALAQIETLQVDVQNLTGEVTTLKSEREEIRGSFIFSRQSLYELEFKLQASNAELEEAKASIESNMQKIESTATGGQEELRVCKAELEKALASANEKEIALCDMVAQVAAAKEKLGTALPKKPFIMRELIVAGILAVVGAFSAGLSARSCPS